MFGSKARELPWNIRQGRIRYLWIRKVFSLRESTTAPTVTVIGRPSNQNFFILTHMHERSPNVLYPLSFPYVNWVGKAHCNNTKAAVAISTTAEIYFFNMEM